MQTICPLAHPNDYQIRSRVDISGGLDRENTTQYGPQHQLRIVNGEPARRGMFPYAAALSKAPSSVFSEQAAICGATLISPRHLITAAHCTSSLTERATFLVGGVCTRRTLWDGCYADGRETMRSVEIDFAIAQYYEFTPRHSQQENIL